MPLTLIHTPATLPVLPPPPDSRDFQTLPQVQNQVLIAQNNAGHAIVGATPGDFLYAVNATTIGGTQSLLAGSFPLLAPNGTLGAPSYAFASSAGRGIYTDGDGIIFANGGVATWSVSSGSVGVLGSNTSELRMGASQDARIARVAAGIFAIRGPSVGAEVKADALPTIASGFGTSPSITAGSTPFAGSVNVGTGGVATSGVINFNGTAFPSAPFVVCMNTTSATVVRATTSATQLTITGVGAFTASDVIAWICVSSM